METFWRNHSFNKKGMLPNKNSFVSQLQMFPGNHGSNLISKRKTSHSRIK